MIDRTPPQPRQHGTYMCDRHYRRAKRGTAPRPVPAIYDGDPDDLRAYQAWVAAHTAGVER